MKEIIAITECPECKKDVEVVVGQNSGDGSNIDCFQKAVCYNYYSFTEEGGINNRVLLVEKEGSMFHFVHEFDFDLNKHKGEIITRNIYF